MIGRLRMGCMRLFLASLLLESDHLGIHQYFLDLCFVTSWSFRNFYCSALRMLYLIWVYCNCAGPLSFFMSDLSSLTYSTNLLSSIINSSKPFAYAKPVDIDHFTVPVLACCLSAVMFLTSFCMISLSLWMCTVLFMTLFSSTYVVLMDPVYCSVVGSGPHAGRFPSSFNSVHNRKMRFLEYLEHPNERLSCLLHLKGS